MIPYTNMIPISWQAGFFRDPDRVGWVAYRDRGSGKTAALLMKCLMGAKHPGWQALFIDPYGYADSHLLGMLDNFKAMGFTHEVSRRRFVFASGARITFAKDENLDRYRGFAFDFVAADFPEAKSIKEIIRQGRLFEQIQGMTRAGELSFPTMEGVTI